MKATCGVEGCGRIHYGLGYCQMHWYRWKKTGNVGDVAPLRMMSHPAECAVEGCDEPYHAKGYCNPHYKRFIEHGDPLGGLNEFRFGEEPTPHDRLTYEGWNRYTTPLPPLEAIHNAAQRTYAAQNERDGYLTDPEYIAAVAAWHAAPLDMAAD